MKIKELFWIDDDITEVTRSAARLFPLLWGHDCRNNIILVGNHYMEGKSCGFLTEQNIKELREYIYDSFAIFCNIEARKRGGTCTEANVWDEKEKLIDDSMRIDIADYEGKNKDTIAADIVNKLEEVTNKVTDKSYIGLDCKLFRGEEFEEEPLVEKLFRHLSTTERTEKYKVFPYTKSINPISEALENKFPLYMCFYVKKLWTINLTIVVLKSERSF